MSSGPATPEPGVVLASARRELARLPGLLDTLLGGLEATTWRARPAPAEWSPVEIVCHLRDEEVFLEALMEAYMAGGKQWESGEARRRLQGLLDRRLY